MRPEQIKMLARKYAENKATAEERAQLHLFFDMMQKTSSYMTVKTGDIKKRKILNNISNNTSGRLIYKKAWSYIAAASIILLIVSVGFFSETIFSPGYIVQKTESGEKKVITLSDGSIVTLNGKTTLTYPEEFGTMRNVELEGEAFFKVKRNPDKPFVVHTQDLETKVLGTSFNINSYSEEKAQVSVNTGRVEVSVKADETAKVVLHPDQQVTYKSHSLLMSKSNSDIYSAWTRNIIVFNNQSLEEIARILENWFAVEIAVEQNDVRDLKMTAKFRDENLENIFKSIEHLKAVKIDTITPKHFHIRAK
ncbi:FecR family protein [Zunongwangia sp. H14]|uniref:FecR family protein n=1 Tax=Zunongwangia sp. H14 TaxID=3240792 RepID=UPI0035689390